MREVEIVPMFQSFLHFFDAKDASKARDAIASFNMNVFRLEKQLAEVIKMDCDIVDSHLTYLDFKEQLQHSLAAILFSFTGFENTGSPIWRIGVFLIFLATHLRMNRMNPKNMGRLGTLFCLFGFSIFAIVWYFILD